MFGEISQFHPESVFTSDNSANDKDRVEGLQAKGLALVVVRIVEETQWLTMAITIIPSSQPQARTICVRTKHLRITLNSEIPKKTEVTIRIALFRLSSKVTVSATSILLSIINEQRAWGSHPHLEEANAKKNQTEMGKSIVIFEDPHARLF